MSDQRGDLDFAVAPNCPVCLRPMEVVETGGVLLWECGYGCDLDAE